MKKLSLWMPLLGLPLVAVLAAGCEEDPTCGNGKIEAGESCDGSNLGGASCQSLGYVQGSLGCTHECLYDVGSCEGLVDCGNGAVDTGEQCDGSELEGQTCESLGLGAGTLLCDPFTCQFDLTGCEGRGICGDGIADGEEQCDGEDLRGATCPDIDPALLGGTLSCSPGCTFRTSGCYVAPGFPIGEACSSDADCQGGICYLEFGGRRSGAPGGMCYERCGEENDCPLAGEAGVCAGSMGPSYCYRRCDPDAPDCRPGYECVSLGDRGFCYPHCTDDEQCVVTGLCEDDPSADRYGFCVVPPEICTGGVDEDMDGRVDCEDSDCNGTATCPLGEDCYDGLDNDGDNGVDCDDGECVGLGHCTGLMCDPPAEATLSCGSVLEGESNNATGSTAILSTYSCLAPDRDTAQTIFGTGMAPEYAYRLTVPSTQLVTIHLSGFTGNLDAMVVKETAGQYCEPDASCFAYGNAGTGTPETITFAAYPTVDYYVIVDGRQGNVSTFDISVSCDSTTVEDCGNAADDDGDSLVDCADPECMGVPPHCAP
ncbi:MAG: PPC domain-containing protein [Polyangia bacterium]|jgi:hypothetical protein|nr:PPC domain-containing protein [Polyangia bacterium]